MSANEKEEYYKELLERNSILGVINIIEKEVRQETLKRIEELRKKCEAHTGDFIKYNKDCHSKVWMNDAEFNIKLMELEAKK